MAELECPSGSFFKLAEGLYVFPGPTNIGAAVQKNSLGQSEIYFIDIGEDEGFAKKALSACQAEFGNITVKALICTHAHADHIGGAAWLKQKTGCEIWATQGEKSCAESPRLQAYTFYGALPLPEIDTPYFHAPRVAVDKIITGGQTITLSGLQLEFVPLSGHSLEMVGVLARGADGAKAFFAGDGIFGRSMLKRFWIPFIIDPGAFKDSVERMRSVQADFFVPSHGSVYDGVEELAELNLISTLYNEKEIEEILCEPKTHEEIVKAFFDKNDIPMRISQFLLIGSTIRSYLTFLCKEGRARFFFKDNKMYWEKAAPNGAK